jgi:hypothetical protein
VGPIHIAYAAALDFIAQGYPGVSASDFADGHDYAEACRAALWQHVKRAIADAGFDLDDPEIQAAIDDAIECVEDVADAPNRVAFYGSCGADDLAMARTYESYREEAWRSDRHDRPPPSAAVGRPRIFIRAIGRERRPSCNERTRGSRRSRAGPRSSTDDPHESGGDDPPGHHHLLDRLAARGRP